MGLAKKKVLMRSLHTSHACNFQGYVENESQQGLQLVKKLSTSLKTFSTPFYTIPDPCTYFISKSWYFDLLAWSTTTTTSFI